MSQLILQPFCHFTYVTAHSPTLPSLYLCHSSFSNHSVTLPMSQLILQPFRHFTYVTAHSTTLLSLLLHHRLFTYEALQWTHLQRPLLRMSPTAGDETSRGRNPENGRCRDFGRRRQHRQSGFQHTDRPRPSSPELFNKDHNTGRESLSHLNNNNKMCSTCAWERMFWDFIRITFLQLAPICIHFAMILTTSLDIGYCYREHGNF